MCVFQATLLRQFADCRLVQRLLELALGSFSRRHVDVLDGLAPERGQVHVLRSLVRRAATTPFGRDHDFRRIRSPGDFRRLVPLRTPAQLRAEYGLAGQCWPGAVPVVPPADSADESADPGRLTAELRAAQRQAMRTALAFLLRARPSAPLLRRRIYWLGEDGPRPMPRDLRPDELALERFPFFLRCAVRTPLDWERDGTRPGRLHGVESPSCIIGSLPEVRRLLAEMRQRHGEGWLSRLWPSLSAVLYTRAGVGETVEPVRTVLGEGPVLLELFQRLGSPVAVEDPIHEGLRLLTSHGSYFEFVPVEALDRPRPPRLGIAEVRPGEPYELVLSSPAGLWACLTGALVRFERLTPPLLRVLSSAVPAAVNPAPAAPTRLPAPHPRTADTAAVLQETVYRSPW